MLLEQKVIKIQNCEIEIKNILAKKSRFLKLKCPERNTVYIRQTIRNFEMSHNEHLPTYILKRLDESHHAKHLFDTKHSLTPNTELELLHICDK